MDCSTMGPFRPEVMMKIEATTIDELIEKSGPHVGSLRKLDALIVAALRTGGTHFLEVCLLF
jgi:hypothetical protein